MDHREGYDKLMKQGFEEPPSLFNQLRCPTINKEYIQDLFRLPENFLGACTLKEGTFVTILILQSVAVVFSTYILIWLNLWREDGNSFWMSKFIADYDPYLENKNMDLIRRISPLWADFALALLITHAVYFITGFGVWYGLCKNHCNPVVYVPWLVMTAFLVTVTFLTGFTMVIFIFILSGFRIISVTWDIVPMLCVFAYGIAWAYGFAVSLAHYKRRRIVQFWRTNKRKEFYSDTL